MISRIRDIRRQKGWTLADLAEACDPPTTAQTIGRLETGTRNLSLKWMERIGAALGVDPETLVRSENGRSVAIVATLDRDGPQALDKPFSHPMLRLRKRAWSSRSGPAPGPTWRETRYGSGKSGPRKRSARSTAIVLCRVAPDASPSDGWSTANRGGSRCCPRNRGANR